MSSVSSIHAQHSPQAEDEKALRETAERLHMIQRRETAEAVHETRRKEIRSEEAQERVQVRQERHTREKKDRVEVSMPEPPQRTRRVEVRAHSVPSYFLVYKIAPGFREVTVSYEENFHGQFLQSRA